MGGFDLSIAGLHRRERARRDAVLKDECGVSFAVALADRASSAAALLGALAGQICHRFKIQPLIVTLAMGTIAVGLVQVQTPGGSIYGASAPDWLIKLASPGDERRSASTSRRWSRSGRSSRSLMALFLHRTSPAGSSWRRARTRAAPSTR